MLLSGGNVLDHRLIKPGKHRGVERLDVLEHEVLMSVIGWEPDMVVIESYAFGSKYSREALGELGGVIRLALFRDGQPFIEMAPTEWRKILFDNGQLKKEHVVHQVAKLYGIEIDELGMSVDVCEAACVALAYERREAGLAPKGSIRNTVTRTPAVPG